MKYLKVWTDFEAVMAPLNDDEIGRLFLLMLRYARDGEEPTDFEGNEVFIWPTAKRDIDMAAERNEICRQNGLRGGRPKSKENQTEPNETKENQTEAEKKRKETKGNEKERKDSGGRFTPPTIEDVRAYCLERRNNVNPERFIDFYASKGWKVGNQPMKDWRACVRTWEQRDREPAKKVIAQNFPQRDYSEVDRLMLDDLEREVAESKARDAG